MEKRRARAGKVAGVREHRRSGGRSVDGADHKPGAVRAAVIAAGSGEQAALSAFFRAKGEALRRSLPRHEIAAALRALEHERAAMMKAITDRRHSAQAAAQEKRQSQREAQRGGASPPPAYG